MLFSLIEFVGAMLLSFLPPRYRSHWVSQEAAGLARAAWVSGFIQLSASIAFLIFRLFKFMRPGADTVANAIVASSPDPNGMFAAGIVGLANFALQPEHFLAYYFVIEGTVRILTAGISGHPVGSLPLYLVSGLHNWLEPQVKELRMGARVADEVRKGDGQTHEWKVLSCRPKTDWHRNITIRYRGEFYQMFNEEVGPKPRQFVYLLRKPPIGHLVVVIREYSDSPPGTGGEPAHKEKGAKHP